MADIEDVLATLMAVAAAAIYPNGLSAPAITGEPTKVRIGWPDSDQLVKEAEAGITNVTLFPDGVERNTTQVISARWEALPAVPPTLTAMLAGAAVTWGGTPAAGQLAAIVLPHAGYVYAVQAGDTTSTIATALAALIAADPAAGEGATSSGPVVTLAAPTVARVDARIGVPSGLVKEVGQQTRQIRLSVWTADPVARSAAAAAIDQALRPLTRLALPDGTKARLVYGGSPMSDSAEKSRIYRRDLLIHAEYQIVETMQGTPILAPAVTLGTAIPVTLTA